MPCSCYDLVTEPIVNCEGNTTADGTVEARTLKFGLHG